MWASDDSAAFLAHFQRESGDGVLLWPAASSAQNHHLHYRGSHGDTVANWEGDGIILGGEPGVTVEQDIAGDVAESEGVTWRRRKCGYYDCSFMCWF